MGLCLLVCSVNSTLTFLDVSDNPMSAAARKAIEVEFVLCRMRNPMVTKINASWMGFDDQDAIKIVEGLRFVLFIKFPFVCDKETSFSRKNISSLEPPDFFGLILGHYQGGFLFVFQPKQDVADL